MKNPKFFLTTLFAAAAMSATAHAADETISINFDNGSNAISGWNNTSSASGTLSDLTDSTGASTGATLVWSSPNLWQEGGKDSVLNAYLDDGGSGVSITVSGLSYLTYDLKIITATDTDSIGFNYKTVNGVNYYGADGVGIEGTNSWGSSNDTTVSNNNSFTVSGLSGDLSVASTRPGWERGCVAGLIITNTYAGTAYAGTVSGDTVWTDAFNTLDGWVNSATTVNASGAITSTGGTYADLTLTESATLTVDSDVVTDAIYVSGEGKTLTLAKGTGTLTLSGPALLRANDGATLAFNTEAITLAENVSRLSFAGTGTIHFLDEDGTSVYNKFGSGSAGTALKFSGAVALSDSSTTAYSGGKLDFAGGVTGYALSLTGAANITISGGTSEFIGQYNDQNSVLVSGSSASLNFAGGTVTFTKALATHLGGVINQSGGIVNTTGIRLHDTGGGSGNSTYNLSGGVANLSSTNTGNSTSAGILIGHWGWGKGVFNVSDGVLNAENTWACVSWTSPGELNITGGEVNVKGISLDGQYSSWGTNNVATVLLSDNGRLNVGSDGIRITANLSGAYSGTNKAFNFNGGTLGALDSWTAVDKINIGGAVTIDTQKRAVNASGASTALNEATSITLSGVLSGSGSVKKIGIGTLTLSGANTYSGGTTVSGGVLASAHADALGTGAVSVATGGTLLLQVAPSASLSVSVDGGILSVADGLNSLDNSVVLNSGTFDVSGADTFSVASLTTASGSIISLGMLSSDTASLTSSGTLSLDAGTIFDLSPALGGSETITYILAENVSGITDATSLSRNNLLFGGLAATERVGATFTLDGTTLKLALAKPIFTDLTWIGGNGATWAHQGDTLWSSEIATTTGATPKFENGDTVFFNTDGSVAVSGAVQPGGMNVNADVTFTGVSGSDASLTIATGTSLTVADGKTATIDASLGTTGALKKTGTGTLVLDATASSFFSSVQIAEGRVNVNSAESLTAAIATEIAEAATLGFSVGEGGSVTLGTSLSGAGTIEKLGAGTMNVSGVSFDGTLKLAEGGLGLSGTNTFGTLVLASGSTTISSGATSTTNETVVENAELTIATGGSSSALRGKVTLNNGGKLRLTAGDATGWGGGATALNALVINEGGELIVETVATRANQTFNMSGGITLVGGKISGAQDYSKFDLYGSTTGITTLASATTAEISAAVALRDHGTFDVADGAAEIDLLVSGMITNYGQVASGSHYTAAFEKAGAGTLTLAGDNRYWTSGGAISGGKLIAASATALGTGAISVGTGTTLEFTAASGTFANTLSGDGNLVVNTAGAVTLSGTNTGYSGAISVAAGTLLAGSADALGTGAVTVAGGATLGSAMSGSVVVNTLTTESGAILATGVLSTAAPAFSVTGTATLGSDLKFNIDVATASGSYVLVSAGTLNVDLSDLSGDDLLFGGSASGRTEAKYYLENNELSVDFHKAIYSLIWQGGDDAVWQAGGTTLWKRAGADATATFENGDSVTFSTADASVAIAGSVSVGDITATENATVSAGTGSAALSLSGIATVAEGKTLTFDKTVATSGTLTKEGAGTFAVSAGAETLFATIDVAEGKVAVTNYDGDAFDATVSAGATFAIGVDSDATATYSSSFTGSGTFEKIGAGTLVVSGNNSSSGFNGTFLISEGLVELGSANALGTSAVSLVVATGGTIDLKGMTKDGYYGNYTLAGGTLLNNDTEIGTGARQLAGGITLTADSVIGGNANFGMISGGYAANVLTLNGNALTKTGTNAFYLVNTTIQGGDSGKININDGSIQLFNNTASVGGNLTLTSTGDGFLNFNGCGFTLNEGATVKIVGNFSTPATVTVGTGATLDMTEATRKDSGTTGTLSVYGTAKIANMSSGVGSNFGGEISIEEGGVLDVVSAQTGTTVGFKVNDGVYRYSGSGESTLSADGGSIVVRPGVFYIEVANSDAVLNIEKLIEPQTWNAAIAVNAAGTVVLAGANTYTAGTTLTAGTLKLANASALGTGALVLNGGTLAKADTLDSFAFTSDVYVNAAVNVQGIGFSGGTWTFGSVLDTTFAGVALTDVTFADTTIDVSGVDFDEDNLTMTLFTNYAGTDASVFTVADGSDAGTIKIENNNVIFTAGANYLSLTWDPADAETANDKIWTGTLFNGTDYSARPDFRKYKFLATTDGATEAGTIKGEVTAARMNVFGNYTFSGAADDAGTAAKISFGTGRDDTDALTGMTEVSVADGATIAFDNTVATEGQISKDGAGKLVIAADAASVVESVQILNGTFGLSVADGNSAEYAGRFYGNGNEIFEKLGAGTLTLTDTSGWFGGTFIVSEGTLVMGSNAALGAADKVAVVVGENGTLDLNGQTADTNYGNYTLAGGALVNNTTEIGSGTKQFTGTLTLTADSSVGGNASFGLISSGWGPNKIDLGNYTLTKTGTNAFFLANTTVTSGTIDIRGGSIQFVSGVTADGDVTFSAADDANLSFDGKNLTITAGSNVSIVGMFTNPGTLTVNTGATLDLTNASRKEANQGNGSLVIDGGTVKIANLNWGVGGNWGANFNTGRITLKNGGILNITEAQNREGGARVGFNVASGIGTYLYSGTETNYVEENETNQQISVASGATLVWNAENAAASLEVSKLIGGDGAVKIDSTGTVTLSGANTYTGGTTLAAGTLKISGDSALGTGTVKIESGAILETGVSDSTTIGNVLAGTGTVNVKGDTTLGGANSFSGTYAVTDGATLTLADGAGLGSGVEKMELASGTAFKNLASTSISGTISGSGTIVQSAGELNLRPAQLGSFTGSLTLEGGTLSGVVLDASSQISAVNVLGGTMKNWTVDNESVSLTLNADNAVSLSGMISLTTGTLALEKAFAETDSYFTGKAEVVIGSDFIFDFRNLDLVAVEGTDTLTATVKMFDAENLTLSGWDTLTWENINIRGNALDAHYSVEIGSGDNAGKVTVTLTSQTIIWTGDASQIWNASDLNWKLAAGDAIVFADRDTVSFTSNADVTLSGDLKPAAILVDDNVTLSLSGDGRVLDGATTTLGDGAVLKLVADATATPTFESKVSGTGTFELNNAADVSFSETLNDSYSLSGNIAFVKTGSGTLAADATQGEFTGTTSINEGKILVSATDALGTGTLTLNGGSLEVAADANETVTVNNVIAGTTATGAPLTISGRGDVVLTQANTYAGTTSVSGNAIAQNGAAFGTGNVEISGSVVLDAADATFENAFSGSGELTAAKSATLSGDISGLTGTLEVQSGATLQLDSASTFAGTAQLASGATLEKTGSDTLTLAGAISADAASSVTASAGVLAVGNDATAQSLAGTLTVDAAFEKIGTNTLTLSGELAGTGSIAVKAGTLKIGSATAQSFAGTFTVDAAFEKIGTNTLTLNGIAGSGATTVSEGVLELNTANDTTLNSAISGAGTLKKSGAGALTLAAGTNVASVDLAAGTLKDAKLGTDGVTALAVSGSGTTLEALTMDGGTLDLSANGTTLAGTTSLSGGTILLGDAASASLIVTGTTTLRKSDTLVFNFKSLDYPENTNPNTLGDSATVVYQVFSLDAGATLTGWNDSVLGTSNFSVGSGAELSDRATLAFNDDGSVVISNTIYDLVWSGGDGVWTTGDAGKAMWTHTANPDDTAYMNSDRVSFNAEATVTLGANVAPTSLNIADGVALTIAASETYKITGAGTVAVGNGASLTLNSAHDYTGTTTLGDGATLRLNLAANDSAQFKSNLELKDSKSGIFIVDTEALGATAETTFNTVFTGTFGDGAWLFKKEGAGVLRVESGKLSAFGEDDRVNVAAGTLKLMSVDAIGTAKASVESGAVLEVVSASDAEFATSISGKGTFRKSGGGTVTLATANMNFGGDVSVAEGTLKLENASALGDSRTSTAIEIARNANLEVGFGGSFGKELSGEGNVNYSTDERLILTADSAAFSGTFVIEKDNANLAAKQATSLGNGTIDFKGAGATLAFELTPASGQQVADTFAGSFNGTGTVAVETGTGISMTLSGSSQDFDGSILLKNASTLIAEKGEALGSADALVSLGNTAELYVGSAEDSELAAKISGSGSLTKIGAGTVVLANSGNDFSGNVTVKDGLLYATSSAALGKSSQILVESTDSTLKLAVSGTETFGKLVRGRGNFALTGGGTLNWTNPEKRFSGVLSVSDKTSLNTSDFLTVDSGSVVLDNGAVWNANGGFSVEGDATIKLFAATSSVYNLQSHASQTLTSGAELRVGSFVAASNKSGTITLEDIAVVPTDGGTGALITFSLDSVDDAKNARIVLTEDASVSLDGVAVEVTLDESIADAWDVPEIAFVYCDGKAADISGEVEQVAITMADGTEVKYVYDSRTGSLSLSPISPDMNLAYAAMVAMPTEVFNQDVMSLHRRMEQRRFETLSNKDEWQFFAQAQSMQIENGNDRSDSATFDFSTYGALVGGDVRLNESTVIGMALAYDRGNADIHDNQGEIDMDSYRATVYAGTVWGDYCFAEAGAHFGFSSYEIDRKGDYGDNKGETDGWSAGAFATTGCLIPTAIDDFYFTPYVGVAYLHTAIEEVEETGTRSTTTEDFEADSLRARVGIGASYSFAIGEMPTRFGLDLAYSHEFLDDEVDADVGATGVAYSRTITEKALPEDAVSVGASFDFTLSENTALFLNCSADFGTNSDVAYRGNVGFRFTY